MKSGRLSFAVFVAILASGPALAQSDADSIARRLFGPVQEMTAILAGKAPRRMPVPTYEEAGAARAPPAALALTQAADLQLSSILTQATDQVSAVEVRAPGAMSAVGPAWWKVSSKGSVVWIIATPDIIPVATQWDQRVLQRRMSTAKLLIVPGAISAAVLPKGQPVQTLPTTSLDQRLPPDLLARLTKRIGLNNAMGQSEARKQAYAPVREGNSRIDTLSPLLAPNEYTSVTAVTQRLVAPITLPGSAGNPVRNVAVTLANRQKVPILSLPFSAAAFSGYRSRMWVGEDVQETCLSYILDLLDQGQSMASLDLAVGAWASGDVEHALKRYDPMNGCDYGPSAADFWSPLVGYNLAAIQKALATPGESVAVIEFDPLLSPGGVLAQLKSQGYAVASPSDAP
ncbi:MAG: TraB/GumN family protein [Caulobacteraceae bacterium]|nr:TraB/GumN family protein [Caulobacteraceae bacterium]